MGSLYSLMKAIETEVKGVSRNVIADGRPIAVKVGIGWPPQNALQDVARIENRQALISVYDLKISRETTRWKPHVISQLIVEAGLSAVVSAQYLEPLGSATITLSGTPKANDAISAVVTNLAITPKLTRAQVAGAPGGATLGAIAADLATLINGDDDLSTWLTASAAGAVITITSKLASGQLELQSNTGNIGSQIREIGRRMRQLQVVVWCRTEEERQAVSNPIDTMIQRLSADFGVTLDDGSPARILYVSDCYIEGATLEDVLRRDFRLSADYAITTRDVLYSVLAPIPDFATF